jgi:hypothetical protein
MDAAEVDGQNVSPLLCPARAQGGLSVGPIDEPQRRWGPSEESAVDPAKVGAAETRFTER